jgi:hypothetical protein
MMAMPRHLLMSSCRGGLFPFEVEQKWMKEEKASQALVLPIMRFNGIGE